jgi:secondary thiamine-phosphate synthase enzyme
MPAVLKLTHPASRQSARPGRTRSIVGHVMLSIETRRAVEFVDVTDALSQAVSDVALVEGILVVQARHTTIGVMVNEREPLLMSDLEAMFERLAPSDALYAHDDFARRTVNLGPGERRNGHAHCRAALLRTSETLSVVRGRLDLGRWQRVFLVEFDGGQSRELSLTMIGAGGASR